MCDITCESVPARTEHYVKAFVRKNAAHVMVLEQRYGVLRINDVSFEVNNVKNYFNVKVWFESGVMCKINGFACLFHCINTCCSLRRCLNTQPKDLCSNIFLVTQPMSYHDKNIYDLDIEAAVQVISEEEYMPIIMALSQENLSSRVYEHQRCIRAV